MAVITDTNGLAGALRTLKLSGMLGTVLSYCPSCSRMWGCLAPELAGRAGTGGSGEVSMPGGTGIVITGAGSWRGGPLG